MNIALPIEDIGYIDEVDLKISDIITANET